MLILQNIQAKQATIIFHSNGTYTFDNKTYETPRDLKIEDSDFLFLSTLQELKIVYVNQTTKRISVSFNGNIATVVNGKSTSKWLVLSNLAFKIDSDIIPVTGKIYPEKIDSEFKFHIYNPEQKDINQLVFDTIYNNIDILKQYRSLISVLPINKKLLNLFYRYPLIPTIDGRFIYPQNIMLYSPEYMELFNKDEINWLLDSKYNVVSYTTEDREAVCFLNKLTTIHDFTENDFNSLFSNNKIEHLVQTKPIEWLNTFYSQCQYDLSEESFEKFRKMKLILCNDGNFHSINEIYLPIDSVLELLPTDIKAINEKIYEQNQYFFSSLTSCSSMMIANNLVAKIEQNEIIPFSMEYFTAIAYIIKNKLLYKTHKIFISNKGVDLYSPNILILSSKYDNEYGDLAAELTDYPTLYDGYLKFIHKDEIREYMILAGINIGLPIIKNTNINQYPLKNYLDEIPGSRSRYEEFCDWTFPNFKSCEMSISFAKLLWITLKTNRNKEYAIAKYRPNIVADYYYFDSTLIYRLKQICWIPDIDTIFNKPQNIVIEDLYPSFNYDSRSLLQFLDFGKKYQELSDNENYIVLSKSQQRLSNEIFCRDKKYIDDTVISDFPVLFSYISKPSQKEKELVSSWYHGKCQICGNQFNGKYSNEYFMARNILHWKKELPSAIGWNTLSLCPNCIVRYIYCEKDLCTFTDQVLNGQNTDILIQIENHPCKIHYKQEHFSRLKRQIKFIVQELIP